MGEKESVPTNVPKKMGHTFASKLLLLLPTSLAFFPLSLIQKTVSSLSTSIYLYSPLTCIKHSASSKPLIFIISSFSISLLSFKDNNQKLFFLSSPAILEEMDEFVNLKETELRLGLPGTDNVCEAKERVSCCNNNNKRVLSTDTEKEIESSSRKTETSPPRKAQIVGWPPVRSYRKNNIQSKKNESEHEGQGIYVKVSMDGAPYLRKIDLSCYKGYSELLKALEVMFKFSVGEYFERDGYKGSDFVPTYEDKDGDWMLIGDVPWE
jgi:auxin-responsive protein IAA